MPVKRGLLVRSLIVAGVAAAIAVPGALAASARTGTPGAPQFTTVPSRVGGALFGASGPLVKVGPNVNVTNKNGAQSETAIAVDPTNAKHILAASNDLAATAIIYESVDGGKTWADAGLNLGGTFCYDPWLDFNAAGDAFFSYECSDQRIAYRLHGTTTWVKKLLTNAGGFPDRDMVVLDNSSTSAFSGSGYIGYDDNGNNNAAHLMYNRTPTNANTWVQSPRFNDGNPTIGVNAAVAPDGTVYATWEDYSGKKIWVDRSTDGGATWGTDHVVTNYRLATASFFICIPPQPDRCVVPMPFTTVIPGGAHAGRLVVTYPDKSTTGTDWDVFTRYSDDGGTTWSVENRLNDDAGGAYQFFPAISASPNGTVAVSFYDTRNDPTNKKTDRYIAFSTNGGATFGVNTKITTAMSDESGAGDGNDYGDYEGIDASSRNTFQQVWTDSRTGTKAEDVFSSRVKP